MEELQAIASGACGGARYGVKIRLPHALVMTLLFRRDLNPRQKAFAILKLTYCHAHNLFVYVAGYKSGLALLKWLARIHRDRLIQSARDNNNNNEDYNYDFCRLLGQKLVSFLLHGTTSLVPDPTLPRELAPPGFPERAHHALIAGCLSASCAWGDFNSLNYQVLLYVGSRAVVGLWKRLRVGTSTGSQASGTSAHAPRGDHQSTSSSLSYRLATALVWGTAMILFEESPQFLHSSMRKSMDEIYRFDLFGANAHNKEGSGLISAGDDQSPCVHKT